MFLVVDEPNLGLRLVMFREPVAPLLQARYIQHLTYLHFRLSVAIERAPDRFAVGIRLLHPTAAFYSRLSKNPSTILSKGFAEDASRGEPRCTFVNEIIGLPLALSVFPQSLAFSGDAVSKLVEPGLYRKAWRAGHGGTKPLHGAHRLVPVSGPVTITMILREGERANQTKSGQMRFDHSWRNDT